MDGQFLYITGAIIGVICFVLYIATEANAKDELLKERDKLVRDLITARRRIKMLELPSDTLNRYHVALCEISNLSTPKMASVGRRMRRIALDALRGVAA